MCSRRSELYRISLNVISVPVKKMEIIPPGEEKLVFPVPEIVNHKYGAAYPFPEGHFPEDSSGCIYQVSVVLHILNENLPGSCYMVCKEERFYGCNGIKQCLPFGCRFLPCFFPETDRQAVVYHFVA